jgi:hypothetical protein
MKKNSIILLALLLNTSLALAKNSTHPCSNYISSAAEGSAQAGHFDRAGGGNISWNSVHASKGCGQGNLEKNGGAGVFYCFTDQLAAVR